MRRRDPMLLLFAGAMLGINLGVHAIGAVIAGMLFAGAVVAELVTEADARRRSTIVALLLAGVLALGVAAATGWALQGRTLVISDASNPQLLPDGRDPTFLFLERNAGRFEEVHQPGLDDELSGNLETPWNGFTLSSGWGVLLGIGVIGGIVLGWRSRQRALRQGVIAVLVFGALLTVGVVYFAASYDTFVPRHTGLGRFVQYAPLVTAMLAALAIEGIALRLETAQRRRPTPGRRRPRGGDPGRRRSGARDLAHGQPLPPAERAAPSGHPRAGQSRGTGRARARSF